MLKRRWPVLLGPPVIVLLAAGVLALRGEGGARAAKAIVVPRFATCASPAAVAIGPAQPGTWWKTTDQLDATGTVIRRHLYVGHGTTATGRADLAVESSISGPVAGIVVLASDDGSHSQVRLVSVSDRCEVVADEVDDVVRTAILDPRDGSIFAHVVARDTRADLGTVRISPEAGGGWTSRLVAPGLEGDLAKAVGLVYGTGLALDQAGTHLAVQSCTDLACITRVFDLADPGATPVLLRGRDQGPMLGFSAGVLVTWQACVGYPCPILAWDLATDHGRELVSNATSAALTADGRRVVAILGGGSGSKPVEVDVATGRAANLRGIPPDQHALSSGPGRAAGLEVAPDEVAMSATGRDPLALRPDSVAEEALP